MHNTTERAQIYKTGSNPGAVALLAFGTSAADTVTISGQNSSTPGEIFFNGATRQQIYFSDIAQIEYRTEGGSDVIHMHNTIEVGQIYKTGANPGSVALLGFGTSGNDVVTFSGQTPSQPGVFFFNGNARMPVYFRDVSLFEYRSEGGSDDMHMYNTSESVNLYKTGTNPGTVSLIDYGTAATEFVVLKGQVGSTAGSVIYDNNARSPVYFIGIDRVTYNTQGGNDGATVLPGLVEDFTVSKTGAGNTQLTTYGLNSNDQVTIVGSNPSTGYGYVDQTIAGSAKKRINFYGMNIVNYVTGGGSDTLNYTLGTSQLYVYNPSGSAINASGVYAV
jgi:hypothetical protein